MSMQTEILPLGRLRLRPGAGYIVVSQFADDEGFQHPCDERWIFVGFERPKMYPGYVLHIRRDGDQPQPFRLRWGSGGQAEVVQAFEDYVRSPRVAVESVLTALGSDDRNLISKYVPHSSADSEDADLLFSELRRLAGNASVANGRSGIPNQFEAVEVELSHLASRVDEAICMLTQGRYPDDSPIS